MDHSVDTCTQMTNACTVAKCDRADSLAKFAQLPWLSQFSS